MADWRSFSQNLGGISKGFGDLARKKLEMAEAIELLKQKAQIEQEYQSPFDKIIQAGKVSEALWNMGIDPQTIGLDKAVGLEEVSQEVPLTGNILKDRGSAIDTTAEDITGLGLGRLSPKERQLMRTEKIKSTAVAARQKEKVKQDIGFAVNSVKNLMIPMIKAFKSMKEVTKKQTGLEPGRRAGLYNLYAGTFGLNPEVKPFEGQKLEVAAALARIAMPGIRSERAIRTFFKTLPNEWSTDEEAEKQIRNSVHNAFSRGYAAQGLEYGVAEQNKTEKVVEEILAESGYKINGKRNNGFIEGKIYKDAQGNRAVYKEGKFVSIK